MSKLLGKYQAFLTVAEAGSFSEAARRLFVSQPAVSAEIVGLEEALGMRLFHRSRYGVRLTEAGEVLLEHVRAAFSLLESGQERLRSLAGLESGTLRIGASDMTLRFYLLDYIAEFHRRYPGIRLTVTNAPTPRTLEALSAGKIDFGVVSGPISEKAADEFAFLPVREVQDIFVVSPSHPLAGEVGLSREALARYPMIALEGNTSTRAYIEGWLGKDFPPPAISLATSDLLVEFAKRGLGVASLVEDFALPALASGELVRLSLASPPLPRKLYLVHSLRLSHSAAALSLLKLLGVGEQT